MYCNHCGKQINDDSQFCEYCGQQLNEVVTTQPKPSQKKKADRQLEPKQLSPNILKGTDDIYRWSYGMNMWKNPTIFITVWKVMMIGAMFPVLLMTVLTLVEDGFIEGIVMFFRMFLLMGAIMSGLAIIAYPIVAIMNGGSYQVVFELNSKGVNHMQMQKQFKKNQIMAFITVLAGAAAGNPQVAGAGLLAGAKQSSYSEFDQVKKIVANSKRHVIYINESLQHNQVYVAKEDFYQVKDYIVRHCKQATAIDK